MYELYRKGQVLKDQLRDTEKRLANLLEAIEQGILTPTTKQRLDELEARKEALNTSILEEELKKPVLTRELSLIHIWEQVAGFISPDGHFEDVQLIRTPQELDAFRARYSIPPECPLKKIY